MTEPKLTLIERALGKLAPRVFRLPPRLQRVLSGRRAIRRDGLTLDPEMQLLLALRERLKPGSLETTPIAESRRLDHREALVYRGTPIAVGAVKEITVDGAAGPLRARHYAPNDAGASRPLLVFFHGGGFVLEDLDTHDAPCRALCRDAKVHVLSVEYRLAPEALFPAAVDDAYTAFAWARANAASLGADPGRVAVGGDSAGGNLSAVVTQTAAARREPLPAAQLLIYPAVDRSRPWRSLELFAEGFLLSRSDIDWFTRTYAPGVALDDPRLSPHCARDLSGLSPAIVVTAGFDPLRDEGEAYADALAAAGNRVVARREEGLVHGFINMAVVSPAARNALRSIGRDLRELLG
jgi:acetyl esterase